MQALGLRVGRALTVGGVEVDPRGDPDDRPHAVGAHPRDHPARVRELVRVESPGVVLRLPGRVDHDRVERQVAVAVALAVVLDVALVVVDVAALPVPVCPLGQQPRHPRGAQVAAQPRGRARLAVEAQEQRARGAALPDRGPVAEVELEARAVGSRPDAPARARREPRRRGRNRPVGCPRPRASPPGSPGPCSGGRRRAWRPAPAGRRARHGARRGRSATPRGRGPSWRQGERAAARTAAPRPPQPRVRRRRAQRGRGRCRGRAPAARPRPPRRRPGRRPPPAPSALRPARPRSARSGGHGRRRPAPRSAGPERPVRRPA